MNIITWNQLNEGEKSRALERAPQSRSTEIARAVADILDDVRRRGDKALIELTARLDGVRRTNVRVSEEELQAACDRVPPELRKALNQAAENIRRFHIAGKPADYSMETSPGVVCETRFRGIARVGLYAPGGTTPLPSSVLMTGIPARIAECERVILSTAPGSEGTIDPAIAWAARLCQIEEVYLLGGAQAIAAMAFGTRSVPAVDKVFGPGSIWVTEAKQQVAVSPWPVSIDMPAGPSEVMVLADDSAHPRLVAADVLAQLEHGADSQAILVTCVPQLASAVVTEIEQQAGLLARQDVIRQSLQHSRVILTDSLHQAIEVANRYAAEHLIIQTENAATCAEQIRAAGSIFLGPWTPEVLGDYCSGTNHVLPTAGYAASTNGLSVADFMKRITVQQASRTGLEQLGPTAREIAAWEGLTAHAQAVSVRLEILREVAP